ncbi:MAG: helix-turn-helix transcriptional regulator [Anaerolineae bacterium]|nr:helix-turn-helix transcriptional regulator [Anaerolineae bacterium]
MNVQEKLPLREATFFILLSLATTPKHGYAILKDTTQLSDGRVKLGTGTLYGAIKRLLETGWIRRVDDDGEKENGSPKKEYTLTEQGRRIFEAEIARLESIIVVAQKSKAGAEV